MSTIRNNAFFCPKCGAKSAITFPMSITDFNAKAEAFESLHSGCQQTYVSPEPDMTQTPQQRAVWWMENGDHGASSLAMFNFFCFDATDKRDVPFDADDFVRCHKLMKAMPEWRNCISYIGRMSFAWSQLSKAWSRLERLYDDGKYSEVKAIIRQITKDSR